jgi:hemerythrin
MEWTQDLSVGVKEIDDQHKELIRRMNGFFDAMKSGNKEQEILKMLDFLADYVVTHFRDEERLQFSNGYPKYQEHRQMHKDFIADVTQMRSDIQKTGFTAATSSLISTTLVAWLTLHIKKADKEVGAYIRSKT